MPVGALSEGCANPPAPYTRPSECQIHVKGAQATFSTSFSIYYCQTVRTAFLAIPSCKVRIGSERTRVRIPAEETPGPQPDGGSKGFKLLAATAPYPYRRAGCCRYQRSGCGRDHRPPAFCDRRSRATVFRTFYAQWPGSAS